MVMEESNKTSHFIANRVILAAAIVFLAIPLILTLADFLNVGEYFINPKTTIGLAVGAAFIADRVFVKYRASNKNDRDNT